MKKEKMRNYDRLKTKKQEILLIDKGACARVCCAASLMPLVG